MTKSSQTTPSEKTQLVMSSDQRIKLLEDTYENLEQLIKLNSRRTELLQELMRVVGYERQLEKLGLKKEDVAHHLLGEYVSRIDNSKLMHKVKVCPEVSWLCTQSGKRFHIKIEKCPVCDSTLEVKEVRISEFEFHNRYAKCIVAVIDHDGKRHWFDKLIPPKL
jgi:rubrerythrin